MSSRRRERLASLYREAISSFLEREVKIEGGILSVTGTELDSRLKNLKIFFSVWPDENEPDVLKFLQAAKKELRAHLADKVKTKFVPELKFKLDDSEKKRMEAEQLLKKIE